MSVATGAAVWRLMPQQRLARRCWDDECVVFNDLTGDSHLLGGDALAILCHLAQQSADEPSLRALFGDGFAPEEAAEFEQLLLGLSKLHLIERCPA